MLRGAGGVGSERREAGLVRGVLAGPPRSLDVDGPGAQGWKPSPASSAPGPAVSFSFSSTKAAAPDFALTRCKLFPKAQCDGGGVQAGPPQGGPGCQGRHVGGVCLEVVTEVSAPPWGGVRTPGDPSPRTACGWSQCSRTTGDRKPGCPKPLWVGRWREGLTGGGGS